MAKKVNKLSVSVRDALAQALIEKYESDAIAVEGTFPEVAELLKEQFPQAKKAGNQRFFPLTLAEEKARRVSLHRLVAKMNRGKAAISMEEAIQALEDAAALVEASPFEPLAVVRRDLAKFIKLATGLSLDKKGNPKKQVLREGELARIVTLLRGVKLNLTWDKKLMSVGIEPEGLAARQKALKFVGIGEDKAQDVALRHDEYLYGEPGDE